MTSTTIRRELTRGQCAVLVLAAVPMVAFGGLGGWGTFTNIAAEFGRAATALGVVAAGEGVTLVLALVMVGLTMLGQSSPAPVRAGLWLAPLAAAVTGVVVADDVTEAVVYAMTPMAMSAAAEGLGLLARRVVVFRTGVDMEVQSRNAETLQRLAYHRARAANHPDARKRKRSQRAAWRLAKRVGVGDAELGAGLVDVQRERLTEGADAALLDMLTVAPAPVVPEVDEVTDEVTVERVDDDQALPVLEPAEVVIPARATLTASPFMWEAVGPGKRPPVAAAVPAETARQVVTEPIVRTPSELRREARKLHRQAVKSTNRPVTIKTLQDELGLSRREATELRREVVGGDRS
ncbi:hypothetical protein [Streptomyces sp. NTH33]|uniref:hypothetical protein n=1 Tax=Streptomyces sp. NTH33 TaxID=1735453 RepID=UPI0015E8DB6B|nr:hypothetical protein [Streptomyces sp. NTH33]